MSKYTTQLRFICENFAEMDESKGYSNVNSIIASARTKIFDFQYSLFDENYKPVLETKILKHFYTREIGAETVGLWKLWLDTKLNEIIPYYNQMYESAKLEFNPLIDTDITTTRLDKNNSVTDGTGSKTVNKSNSGSYKTDETATNDITTTNTNNGSNSGNSKVVNDVTTTDNGSNSSNGWQYYSDTPQGDITGIDTLKYLTNATHTTNSGTNSDTNIVDGETTTTYSDSNSNTSKDVVDSESAKSTENTHSDTANENENTTSNTLFSNTDEYVEHIVGKSGGTNYSEILLKFRETFINIDMMIIEELNDLFFNLW